MKKYFISLLIVAGFALTANASTLAIPGTLTTGLSSGPQVVVVVSPTANPPAGVYTSPQGVVLTAPGSSSISYTTDGSIPTCASATYSNPIIVSSSQAIEAISCYSNGITSTVASFLYNINNTPVAPANSSGGTTGGSYTPPATPIVGDIDNNGKVDIIDFASMMANWGKTGTNSSDLNNDSKVDIIDFAILMAHWSV